MKRQIDRQRVIDRSLPAGEEHANHNEPKQHLAYKGKLKHSMFEDPDATPKYGAPAAGFAATAIARPIDRTDAQPQARHSAPTNSHPHKCPIAGWVFVESTVGGHVLFRSRNQVGPSI